MSYRFILTADVGGSHISTAICDIADFSVVENTLSRRAINSKDPAEDILRSWSDALLETAQKINHPFDAIAVAMPGPFDYECGISYISGLDKFDSLYGLNIKDYLASKARLPVESVQFRNDAEACIAGEVRASVLHKNAIGVTLGTGFGSAIYAGETTKDLNLGAVPFCDSIADDYLSNRWLISRFGQLTGISVPDVRSMIQADGRKNMIDQVFEEFAFNMLAVLRPAVEQYEVGTLIIAGGIANASSLFLPHLVRDFPELDIRLAQLGDKAALLGSAILFENINATNRTLYKSENETK